jgi:ribonuclease III
MIINPYRELEQALGYRFKKKATLKLALTHPSYRYENREIKDDNQRLEYLGDAVLGLISAEHLFQMHPEAREGDLSKLRSRLTQDRKLARIAAELGIGPYLLLGRGESASGGAERASNLADAMEAILGAAWIDGGPKAAHKIFDKVFMPELEASYEANILIKNNPKGALQELTQSRGVSIPVYSTVQVEGPEHERLFTIEVEVCGNKWRATASSKREGERQAASIALRDLRNTDPQNAPDQQDAQIMPTN